MNTNSGSRGARRAIEAQNEANRTNVNDQVTNTRLYGSSQDQYGGTTRLQENPDGTNTTVSQMGDTGREYLQGMSQLGGQARDNLGTLLQRSIDPNAINSDARRYYDSAMTNTSRVQNDQRLALDSRLRNQGVVPGTEAYDRAMRGFENSASDANARQYDISQRTAHDMALADTSNAQGFALNSNGQAMTALNPTTQVRGLQQVVQTPGPVNAAGLTMQGEQQDAASRNAMWGGVGSILGTIGGAVLGAPGVGSGITSGLASLGRRFTGGF